MRRLRYDQIPVDFAKARSIISDALTDLVSVLDGGWRWREQSRVIDTTIDTGALPVSVTVPGLSSPPESAILLSAQNVAVADGRIISGGSITWEWRGGAILIHAASGLAAATRYRATIALTG
jgi:hypothetical protein